MTQSVCSSPTCRVRRGMPGPPAPADETTASPGKAQGPGPQLSAWPCWRGVDALLWEPPPALLSSPFLEKGPLGILWRGH